jgi:hypothetical protein
LGQQKGSSVRSVQVEQPDGSVIEQSTQAEVQSTIWRTIHQEQYHLLKKPTSVRADYKVTSGTMLSPLQATKYSPAPTKPHWGHMKGRCSCSKLSRKFGKQSHLSQYNTSSPGKLGNIAGAAEQKPHHHHNLDYTLDTTYLEHHPTSSQTCVH